MNINKESKSPRPKPLDYIPKEKPKVPTSSSEWFLYKAQNVYKQLTLNWGRKLVVGAFPFVAYFSLTFFDYRRTRYNFQLQQADFFKQSIACIANSPEVKETYGSDIKLKRATFWTVASGFVPWVSFIMVLLSYLSIYIFPTMSLSIVGPLCAAIILSGMKFS